MTRTFHTSSVLATFAILALGAASATIAAPSRTSPPEAPSKGRTPVMSPILERLMSDRGARIGAAGQRLPVDAEELDLYSRILAIDRAASPPTIRVWMKLDEEGRAGLEAEGIRLESKVGELASAVVPLPKLSALGSLRGIEWIRATERMEQELNVSGLEILSGPLTLPYRAFGDGAIVAVIDSGLDWSHEDFRDAVGNTRLLSFWDQTDNCGSPPAGFGYGCYYTEADINSAIGVGPPFPTGNSDGHGSHVAATAAGDGSTAPAGSFYGIAPEARIVGVKIFEEPGAPSCASCDGGDGLVFAANEGAAFGRPVSVNMSFGATFTFEAREGSSPLEMLIDSMTGPGIPGLVVSKSAGNAGGIPMHVSGTVSTGTTVSRTWSIPAYAPVPGTFNDLQVFTIYYHPADSLRITVVGPTGGTFTRNTGQAFGGVGTPDGVIIIDPSSPPTAFGTPSFIVEVDDQLGVPPRAGTWRVDVRGNTVGGTGRFDMWIAISSYGVGQLFGPWTAPENTMLSSVPATAFNVTAVGAYVTRVSWPNNSGGTTSYTMPPPVGEIADFSSPGPSRDGRLKPEIAAPGQGIGAALAADAAPFADPLRIMSGGNRWVIEGTSMSSPHMAGGYAALLAINPNLDAIQLRNIVTQTARSDAFTGGALPDNTWGNGKLSVRAAADRVMKNFEDLRHVSSTTTFGSAAGWPGATSYNVYRAGLAALSPTSFGACLQSGLAAATFTDAANPPLGQGFGYIMTAVQGGIEGQAGFRIESPGVNAGITINPNRKPRTNAGLSCAP